MNVNSNKKRCCDGMETKKKPVVLALRYRAAPVEIHLTIKNKIKHRLNCSTVANNIKIRELETTPFSTLKTINGKWREIV